MRISYRGVALVVLLAAPGVPAAARSQGAAAQAAQSASGTDVQALVGRLEAARLDYTKNRPADAQRELLSDIDLLHAMQAKGSPQSSAGAGRQLPRGGQDVPMPGLLIRAEPEYPIEAAKRGVTGYVVLDVVIDKSGKVRDPRVVKSEPELDHAALKAVGAWQFAMPTVNRTNARLRHPMSSAARSGRARRGEPVGVHAGAPQWRAGPGPHDRDRQRHAPVSIRGRAVGGCRHASRAPAVPPVVPLRLKMR
jgi:TonB family protein